MPSRRDGEAGQPERGPAGLGIGRLATPSPPSPSGATKLIVKRFGVDGVYDGSDSEVVWVIEMVGFLDVFTMIDLQGEVEVWLQGKGCITP